MILHWSLSDNKSPQVSRIFFSILAILNNTVVWMVSIRPLISKTPKPLSKPLKTVLCVPLATSWYLSLFFFEFHCVVRRESKVHYLASTLFLLIVTRSSLLTGIRWSDCISKSQWIMCVPFSRKNSGLYTYHLIVCSNFNLLHSSPWITFPTESCLVLYYLNASLLHLFIMISGASSVTPHNQHDYYYYYYYYYYFRDLCDEKMF